MNSFCFFFFKASYIAPLKNDESSLIILNYSTIVWSSIGFILILVLFSMLLSVLIAKLVRNRKLEEVSHTGVTTNLSPVKLLKHTKKDVNNKRTLLYANTSLATNPKNGYFKWKLWKSLKKKFNYFLGQSYMTTKCEYSQASNLQVKIPEEISDTKVQSNLYSLYF